MAKKGSFSNEKIFGFGNLTRDPIKLSGAKASTTAVALNVAANSQSYNRDGELIERTEFRNIKVFGRDADMAYANLQKGDRIHYGGRVFPDEYQNKEGELVESIVINAEPGEVYAAPFWENREVVEDDEDDDETPSRSRKRSSSRKSSKAGSSRRRKRQVEEDVAEWDDEEELDDEDLDDDFEEDTPPRQPQRRSRRKPASKKKSSDVDVDDDLDEYEDMI